MCVTVVVVFFLFFLCFFFWGGGGCTWGSSVVALVLVSGANLRRQSTQCLPPLAQGHGVFPNHP